MKRIWWQAGACLLLVILIMVIMHVSRHDKNPGPAVYETPAAAGDQPSSYDHRYPIGRNRDMPDSAMPSQEPQPMYGARPMDRGGPANGPGAQVYRQREVVAPAEDAPQYGAPQGEMATPDGVDQDPGGPFEDGNPEEPPPPEALPED